MSLKLLKSCEYDLVAGGGKNDCICVRGDLLGGMYLGHHDVVSEDICKGLCCGGMSKVPASYSYKKAPYKNCPSVAKVESVPKFKFKKLTGDFDGWTSIFVS